MNGFNKRNILWGVVVVAVIFLCVTFHFFLTPVSADQSATQVVFEIKQGDGFRNIADDLRAAGLIRSPLAFEAVALFGGRAFDMQPGLYKLASSMTDEDIINVITAPGAGEVTVTIPEGSNVYDIDRILSAALVIRPGALIDFHDDGNLEGMLFPDTYKFYTGADVKNVVQEFLDNFNLKAAPLLSADGENATRDLIIASIIQKEVPDATDQSIVAGIILKRLAAGMPLDIDATVCYAMEQEESPSQTGCSPLDLKINSPYNTYLYKGLTPGPIGNPGITAISAAIHPQSSPYWFYLSDPKTGETIFSKTLDEQHQNTVKYLEGK